MDESLVLKNRLKEARSEKGLSQAALAELVGPKFLLLLVGFGLGLI